MWLVSLRDMEIQQGERRTQFIRDNSQKRCWRNDNLSSGEGSKLVNLFFLPNKSGNMRTLHYLRGCVPTTLLSIFTHILPPSPGSKRPAHPLTPPPFCSQLRCHFLGGSPPWHPHDKGLCFLACVSMTPICISIRLTSTCYVPGHVLSVSCAWTHPLSSPACMKYYYYPHFTDEATEVQRGWEIYLLKVIESQMQDQECSFGVCFLIFRSVPPLRVSKSPSNILFCVSPAPDYKLLKCFTVILPECSPGPGA